MKKLLILMECLPENLDAAIITNNTNRRYYTEVNTSAGTVVVTKEQSYFIIDARYYDMAVENTVNCEVVLQDNLAEQVSDLLKKHGAKNVAIEYDAITVAYAAQLKSWLTDFNVVADDTLSNIINAQREIKCPTEQKYIQASQDITDKTFDYALSIIAIGKTEQEIALDMEFFSRKNGSEEVAFSFIVASGPNNSKPHAVPGDRIVETGDFLLMDFGCTYKGYRSDMTRTVAIGEVSEEQKEAYDVVLTAQLKALEGIKAGVKCDDIHNIAASYINSTKFKGKFTHGLGHALGLETHENPRFSPVSQGVLTKSGMVLSVEPGVYLSGKFGVRIEDLICISDDGYHNFTKSKKELIVL